MKKTVLVFVFSMVSCVLAGGLAWAGQTASVSGGLTSVSKSVLGTETDGVLLQILKETWETNPSLLSARAAQKALEESLPQAQAGWKPTVGADASITRTDPAGNALDASTSKDAGLSVEQPLFRGGRTVAEIRAASNAIKAGSARLNAVGQSVLLLAATAYMDVVRDQALVALGEKNRDVIERQLKAAQARFDVGDITRTDVAQAQARLAQAQAGLTAARGDLRVSRAAFLQVTGRVAEQLEKPAISLILPETREAALAMAETRNPGIQAARYDYRASDDDKDAVRGELLPEVAAFGSVAREWDDDDGTTSAFGLRASMPLYEAGAVRARLRAAGHTASSRNMELVAARRLAEEDIVAGWENLQTARAGIDSRRAQVKASMLARDGVHQEADVGARTVLDALDADQELLDAQVALVTAERDEIVAQFALAAALGLLGF